MDPQEPIIVDTPKGAVSFPAGTPPEVMKKALDKMFAEQRSWLDTAADVGTGVVKGAAHTLGTLRNYARDYIPGVSTIDQLPPYQGDPGLTNTAQRVGFGAEQMAEFMAPGGLPKKAAVWGASKVAPLARNAPRVVQAATELIPRMVTEAATSAGITKAQGGDPTTAAGVAAAMSVVGRAAASVAPAIKRAAARQVERFMQPGTKMLKYEATQIAPEVLERGIVGTPERVERLADAQRKAAGTTIKSLENRLAVSLPGAVIDVAPVRSIIARQVRQYMTTGQGGQQLTVAGRETYHAAAQHFLEFANDLPDKIPVKQAADLKRQWQDVVRVARGYMEDAPEQAKARVAKEAAKAMRKSLLRVNTVGELAGAYKEYKFWATLENVLADTALRRTGQQGWGKKMLAATLMGGAGFAGGGGAGAAAMGALSLAVQTPTWKLASAQIKNQLADALVEGNWKQVKFLTDRIIKGTVSQATQEQ